MQEVSLKNFDSSPAMVNLNYNNVREYRSRTGGILSFCYAIIAIVIIIFKLADLFQRNHLTYVEYVIKDVDLQPLDISSGQFRMCFYHLNATTDKLQKIKYSDRFNQGINVSILQYSVDFVGQQQNIDKKKYPMIQCKENQETDYQNYFCSPTNDINHNLSYTILGRVDFTVNHSIAHPIYRRYSLIVETCNSSIQPLCKQYKNNLFPFLVLYNNKIVPQSKQHSRTIQKSVQRRPFQTRVQMIKDERIVLEIYLQRVKIITENSILPQIFHNDNDANPHNIQKNQTWFFNEEIQQYYSLPKSGSELYNALLRRSIFTRKYVRKYVKLDFVLAEIFGFLGLFSLLFFGVYRGYNQYSLQQKIKKDLGLPYDKKTNIFRYYWYNIRKLGYRWFSFCLKKTEGYKQEQRSLRRLSKKLDVSTLRHKKKADKSLNEGVNPQYFNN